MGTGQSRGNNTTTDTQTHCGSLHEKTLSWWGQTSQQSLLSGCMYIQLYGHIYVVVTECARLCVCVCVCVSAQRNPWVYCD